MDEVYIEVEDFSDDEDPFLSQEPPIVMYYLKVGEIIRGGFAQKNDALLFRNALALMEGLTVRKEID